MQCMDLHRSTVKCSVWTYTEVQLSEVYGPTQKYSEVQCMDLHRSTVKCSVWTYTEVQLSAVYGPTQKYS